MHKTEKIYRTVQGDTWDIIAKKLWGNEKLFTKLMEANPQHRYRMFFPEGVELIVPEIEMPTQEVPLPPWKK
jgi:phage tail protein X